MKFMVELVEKFRSDLMECVAAATQQEVDGRTAREQAQAILDRLGNTQAQPGTTKANPPKVPPAKVPPVKSPVTMYTIIATYANQGEFTSEEVSRRFGLTSGTVAALLANLTRRGRLTTRVNKKGIRCHTVK